MRGVCRWDIAQDGAQLQDVLEAMLDQVRALPPDRQVLVEVLVERTGLPADRFAALRSVTESEVIGTLAEQTGFSSELLDALYDLAKGKTQHRRMLSLFTTSSYLAMQQRGDMGISH